jgi:hypothetical protein
MQIIFNINLKQILRIIWHNHDFYHEFCKVALGVGNHKLHHSKESSRALEWKGQFLQNMLESYQKSITNWGQLTREQTANSPQGPRVCTITQRDVIWAYFHQPCQTNVQPVRSAYQPPASSTFLSERTSHQQPAATSQQYSSLRTNQHQPSATSQPNRLVV